MSQSHARLGQTSLTLFLALQSPYWPIPAYSFSLASFMSLLPSASPKLNENTGLRQNQARVHQVGLWFDDGNIILIAEDTPFKVHRSLLSNKSEVFRDMFSLPQPHILDDSELMDGVPVVYMSDNWRDLAFVLKALYDSIQCVIMVQSIFPSLTFFFHMCQTVQHSGTDPVRYGQRFRSSRYQVRSRRVATIGSLLASAVFSF